MVGRWLAAVVILGLAGSPAPAGGAPAAGDGTGWTAITFVPDSGEVSFVLEVGPSKELQVGYMLHREGISVAGFTHTFLRQPDGSDERWDTHSGESPLFNSWSVSGSTTQGIQMTFGVTGKWGKVPTTFFLWVAGDPAWKSLAYDGPTPLSVREGAGTFLRTERHFEPAGEGAALDVAVSERFTGTFAVLPGKPVCVSLQMADGACVPWGRACLTPDACADVSGSEWSARWTGPDGTSGPPARVTPFGGGGPEGWFTSTAPGDYRFEVEAKGVTFEECAAGACAARPYPVRIIVGGVDADWLPGPT